MFRVCETLYRNTITGELMKTSFSTGCGSSVDPLGENKINMANIVKTSILILIISIGYVCDEVTASQAVIKEANKTPTIIDLFAIEFQNRNKKIDTVKVVDFSTAVSRKINGYVVVARGIRKGQRGFEGDLEDELFGVFIVDQRLGAILYTLDMFPTRRWYDYRVSIQERGWGHVTIKSEGDTYGDHSYMKKFDLSVIPPRAIQIPTARPEVDSQGISE